MTRVRCGCGSQAQLVVEEQAPRPAQTPLILGLVQYWTPNAAVAHCTDEHIRCVTLGTNSHGALST
eukprot:94927-Amphidinium_carterae.5